MRGASKRERLVALFYRNSAGSEPVSQWLKTLSLEAQRLIGQDIATLELGWEGMPPPCLSVASRQGLWQIRSSLREDGMARVLTSFHEGQMVLLHGFVKAHETDRDLDLAVKRLQEVRNNGKRSARHLGSSFESHLGKTNLYQEVTLIAWKRVLASEVAEAMRKDGISKSDMAKRMNTSRSQLNRLLDPDNPNVLLETIQKAAAAIGKRLSISLIDELRP
jgi:phage-related protein